MITITRANEYSSKAAIGGWLLGLAWFAYSSSTAEGVPWWGWLVLVIIGIFFASVAVGLAIAFVMGLLTRLVHGSSQASPDLYAWGALVSPVPAFFIAGPVARLFA